MKLYIKADTLLPYNDPICDYLLTCTSIMASTVNQEPFQVGEVVLVKENWFGKPAKHLAIVIDTAIARDDGRYEYGGIPISTANINPETKDFVNEPGSIIVKDFNRFIPGTTMQQSRDVYIQYGNPVTFDSADFSDSGTLKGRLTPKMLNYVKNWVNNPTADNIPAVYPY